MRHQTPDFLFRHSPCVLCNLSGQSTRSMLSLVFDCTGFFLPVTLPVLIFLSGQGCVRACVRVCACAPVRMCACGQGIEIERRTGINFQETGREMKKQQPCLILLRPLLLSLPAFVFNLRVLGPVSLSYRKVSVSVTYCHTNPVQMSCQNSVFCFLYHSIYLFC